MAKEEEYDLRFPPGTPNLEELLTEVIEKFNLKLIAPKDLDSPYYLAVRGPLEAVKAAKEHIRKRLAEMVADMEKKYKT
ncbi:MAG: hypothetical protein HWN65_06855 [Candidatus Helarchaeota archaeon]|nr:hypothetical protein [Candidatus Helarchaeota archaeon]